MVVSGGLLEENSEPSLVSTQSTQLSINSRLTGTSDANFNTLKLEAESS